MSKQRETLALVLVVGLLACLGGCSNRTTANGSNDGGVTGDGPYLVDDAGNVVIDDAGHPVPVQQDAAVHGDGPVTTYDAAPGPQQDSGATPGIITCGQATCDATTQQCCVSTQGSASCIDSTAQCQGLPVACDGPEDCSTTDPVCCASLGGGGGTRGVTCTTEANCRGQRLCRLDTDCAQGDKCCGSGTVGGTTASWCLAASQCPSTNPTTGVPCGTATCNSPDVCCTALGGQSCTAANACQGLALACDGPEDCSGGTPVCCGQLGAGGGGTECVAADSCQGGGMGSGIVCHTDADCPTGTCTTLQFVNIRICR